MSHFSVAVIHRASQSVDDLLAPFDENMDVEPYIKFTRSEAISYARKNLVHDGETKTDDECLAMAAAWFGNKTDDDGNVYSTYNPDAKWDWYQVGGRWDGLLRLKETGEYVNSAKICDIDFSIDPDEYERCLRYWDVIVDHKEPRLDEDFHSIYKEEYFREYYGNRETYARYMTSFSTYAVISPEGTWFAKGEMGWFGASSETPNEAVDWEEHFMKRFINNADKDLFITIVDCHI